jgi:hypothetical protein
MANSDNNTPSELKLHLKQQINNKTINEIKKNVDSTGLNYGKIGEKQRKLSDFTK